MWLLCRTLFKGLLLSRYQYQTCPSVTSHHCPFSHTATMLGTLLLLLGCTSTVSGIKLRGACPVVPPSITLSQWSTTVLYSIPFSKDTPSYLFREITKSPIGTHKIRIMRTRVLQQHHIIKEQLSPTDSVHNICRGTGYFSNDSFHLESTIGMASDNQSLPCFPPIQEDIRVWVEGCYIFIWSCVDSKDDDWRDEALIIVSIDDPKYLRETKDPQNRTNELRQLARKHMSRQLAQRIDLTYPGDAWQDGNEDRLFICPGDVYTAVVIFICVLGLIGVLWYFAV